MASHKFQTVSSEQGPGDCPFAEHQAFQNLVRTYECMWGEHTKFFQKFGVTAQQYNVLKVLHAMAEGEGVACQAIAERLLNRVPDITRLLDRLEQAELIRRERCCSDRRVVRTFLTKEGRAKVDAIHGPLTETLENRFAHMSEGEVRELNRLLLKLREPGCSPCEEEGETIDVAE